MRKNRMKRPSLLKGRTSDETPLVEACRRLGLSWPQVWRLVLRGELQGRKVRGRWHVSASDVERLIGEHQASDGAPTTAA